MELVPFKSLMLWSEELLWFLMESCITGSKEIT
jgi:hypothetical protein